MVYFIKFNVCLSDKFSEQTEKFFSIKLITSAFCLLPVELLPAGYYFCGCYKD